MAKGKVSPELIEQFKQIVGEKYVYTDKDKLEPYSHDEVTDPHYMKAPQVVVLPATTEEVSKVVETVAQPVESVKAESAVPVAAVVADSVEENPVQARRAMTDKQKKAQKKGPNGEDDLTIVEGIGPKINGVLHVAGINTYAELANSSVETLRQILVQNSLQYHDPGTWAEQSALAAADKWDELEQLQGTLSGGKRK